MLYAIIKENKVFSVEELSDEQAQEAMKIYQQIVLVDEATKPSVGWIFNGSSFEVPIGENNQPVLYITRLAMQNRFTDEENVMMRIYMDNPSAPYRYHVKVLMDKLSSATYIDLSRPDTQRGIGLLALAGIITTARANIILTTKPSSIEIYRG